MVRGLGKRRRSRRSCPNYVLVLQPPGLLLLRVCVFADLLFSSIASHCACARVSRLAWPNRYKAAGKLREAQARLGNMLRDGRGSRPCDKKALVAFRGAALQVRVFEGVVGCCTGERVGLPVTAAHRT